MVGNDIDLWVANDGGAGAKPSQQTVPPGVGFLYG